MKKFFKEFKAFISKGNVFDMAVGLIIATAFNKIVSSLVNDIIMPLVTWATGKASLADMSIVLRRAADGTATLTWKYGNFCQTVIDFLIIAFSVFLMVKIVTSSQKKFKEIGTLVIKETTKLNKEEKRAIKKRAKEENKKYKVVREEYLAERKAKQEEDARIQAEEKAKADAEYRKQNPTQEDLLKEIRDLLKKQK